jgi:hypothetical protein
VSGPNFTSAFGSRLDEYVEFKRAMGFNGASRIWYLRRFDAYCAERALGVFDRATVEEWVTAQLAPSGQ